MIKIELTGEVEEMFADTVVGAVANSDLSATDASSRLAAQGLLLVIREAGMSGYGTSTAKYHDYITRTNQQTDGPIEGVNVVVEQLD